MSLRQLTLVWEHSKQKGGALIIMLAIADFSDDAGTAFPSVETLATKSRMSERNARYVLGELEASGELAIERGAGRSGSNLYRITVTPNLDLFGGQKLHPTAKIAPLKNTAEIQGGGLKPASAGAAIAIAPEPSLTVIKREPSVPVAVPKSKKTALPADFGISEKVRAWARESGFETYLEAHLEYFRDWASNDKRYVEWDATFRNAIRCDWGDIRKNLVRQGWKPKAETATALCQFVDRPGNEICGATGAKPDPRYGNKEICAHHSTKLAARAVPAERVAEHLSNMKKMARTHA